MSPAVTGDGAWRYLDRTGPDSDHALIGRELGRLTDAYPQFRFGHEAFGRSDGVRWIARRRDGLQPGLHTVITASLGELDAALAGDQARHGPVGKDEVLRYLL